jgi:Chaperone of endosialidase
VAASQYLQSNGNGSGLTNLNASSITTGTLANARLGQIPTANIADSAVTAPKIASGQVVKTLNGMTDSVTLAAGSNISITPAGNTLTIASTGGGGCPSPCTAAIFNATQQYNILGNRVLSTAGGDNLFAGDRAGQSNTTGEGNTFVGKDAGFSNISGNENSFFGARAGLFQSTGNQNAFFGIGTGANNAGNRNSAFGTSAGAFGNTGSDNSYFGAFSGTNNSGNFNTIIGASSDQAVNVSNATALGARAFVTQNNSLVLGSIAGVNGASTSVNVGIGTTAPQASLHVVGGGIVSQPGDARSVSIGIPNGESGISIRGTTNRADVRFDGDKLKLVTGLGTGPPASTNGITISTNGHVDISGDIDIGANGSTPDYGSRLQSNGAGVNRAIVGYNPSGNAVAGVSVAGEGVFGQSTSGIGVRGVAFNPGAAAIVANGTSWFAGNTTPLTVTSSTGLVIGSDPGSDSGFIQAIRYDGGQVAKTLSLNNLGGRVGIGTIAPTQTLDVNGRARIRDVPDTFLSFGSVCLNQASDLVRCGASSLKLKKNIRPYRSGLDVIGRLRPISYDSKEDGSSHIGLGAEDVAKVDPSLALSDANGEIRGVKYERLNMLLINAVQEQQKIIENQQQQIDQLKRLTCRKNKKAAICKGTK